MKLVQYLVNGGKRYGIMQETGIIDLAAAWRQISHFEISTVR